MRVMEPARKKQRSIFDFFSESQSGSSTSSATVEEHELQPLGISLSQECRNMNIITCMSQATLFMPCMHPLFTSH